MAGLTLDQAMKIIEVGFAHGRQTECLPLGIATWGPDIWFAGWALTLDDFEDVNGTLTTSSTLHHS